MGSVRPWTCFTCGPAKEIPAGPLCDPSLLLISSPDCLCGLPSWGWQGGVRPWVLLKALALSSFSSPWALLFLPFPAVLFLLVVGATLVFPLRWCSSSAEQWVRDGSLWWKSRASHRVPYRKCSVLIWSLQRAALRLWANKLLHNAFFQFYFECFLQKPVSEARLSWHTLWEAGAGRLPQTILGSLWNTVLRGKKKSNFRHFSS